jgi:uncharacterized protein
LLKNTTVKTQKFSINISDSIGKVSAEIIEPDKMKSILVFAHGAGAPMGHAFMAGAAKLLAEHGIGTLRFNFPYMENKKGRPDVPAVAEKTIESSLAEARTRYPKLKIFAGGKSFGGRMTSSHIAKANPGFVEGVVFFGFPLHAPGKPSIDRADHLSNVKKPMLFLQGTRDALADLALIQQVVKKLPTATLRTFERADHSFKSGKTDFMPQLVEATVEWIRTK